MYDAEPLGHFIKQWGLMSTPTPVIAAHLGDHFFLKDDNTRISATKKDHVGNEQKRFLLYPMKILHTKYQSESKIPVSYTFFCRNRPKNVVIPILKDRDVCVCKLCDNFSYQIEQLHREKVITSPNTEEVLSSLVCSTSNIDCMF